jgi:hypothetical protein
VKEDKLLCPLFRSEPKIHEHHFLNCHFTIVLWKKLRGGQEARPKSKLALESLDIKIVIEQRKKERASITGEEQFLPLLPYVFLFSIILHKHHLT